MICPTCNVEMRQHSRIPIWTCRRLFCANFDRPMYERMPAPATTSEPRRKRRTEGTH